MMYHIRYFAAESLFISLLSLSRMTMYLFDLSISKAREKEIIPPLNFGSLAYKGQLGIAMFLVAPGGALVVSPSDQFSPRDWGRYSCQSPVQTQIGVGLLGLARGTNISSATVTRLRDGVPVFVLHL